MTWSVVAGEQPLMPQVSVMVSDLASDSGFTDEDATKVSIFLIGKLIGPKPDNQNLITRISKSEPELVRVFVAYDFGIGFSGFEFVFRRGDPEKGMRWAHFESLEQIPSE